MIKSFIQLKHLHNTNVGNNLSVNLQVFSTFKNNDDLLKLLTTLQPQNYFTKRKWIDTKISKMSAQETNSYNYDNC